MSTAAKLFFGACCVTSIGIIGYVHYKQEYDRKQLHMGVVRDLERQERRRLEKLHRLQQEQEASSQQETSVQNLQAE